LFRRVLSVRGKNIHPDVIGEKPRYKRIELKG